MKNACPFYNVFHVLKVLLLKLIQPPDLSVLAVFISPYISRYHFHIFLELHPTLSDKIIFLTNFHFLMDSLNPSHPLNSQNLLSVTKVFFYALLNLLIFKSTASILGLEQCTILPRGENSIKCCDLACNVELLLLKNCDKDLTMKLEVNYFFQNSSSGTNFIFNSCLKLW